MTHDNHRAARLEMIEQEIARYCHSIRHGQPTFRVAAPQAMPNTPMSAADQLRSLLGQRAA